MSASAHTGCPPQGCRYCPRLGCAARFAFQVASPWPMPAREPARIDDISVVADGLDYDARSYARAA